MGYRPELFCLLTKNLGKTWLLPLALLTQSRQVEGTFTMRITFVSNAYLPVVGGAEIYLRNVAEGLVKRGHEVSVVCGNEIGKSGFEEINGVKVHRLDGIKFVFRRAYFWPGFEKKLVGTKPEIVHVIGHGSFFTVLAKMACERLGVPFVVLTYGPLKEQRQRTAIEQILAEVYDAIVTPGIFQAAAAVLYRVPCLKEWCEKKRAKQTFYSPTGIEKLFFEKAGEKSKLLGRQRLIGFVGTFCKRKGVHHLAEAMPEVLREFPGVRFVFVGGKEFETEGGFVEGLRQRVKELGVEKHAVFYDKIAPANLEKKLMLRRLLDSLDVFVLPSSWEAISQAMLQAMARGKPIVVAEIPQLKGVISEKNGMLVEYGNVGQIAGAVKKLLGNKKLAQMIGRENVKTAKNYSMEKIVEMLEKTYEDVLNGDSERRA